MARKKAAQKNLIPDDAMAALNKLARKTKGKFLSSTTRGEITIKIKVNHYDDGSKEIILADEVIPIIKQLGKRPGRPNETQVEFLKWVEKGIRRCDAKMHLQENGIYLSQEDLAAELGCDASYLSTRMNTHGIRSHRGSLWLATPDDWERPIWSIGLDEPESLGNNPVNYIYSSRSIQY